MTIRRKRLLLWTAASLLGAASAAIALAGVFTPYENGETSTPSASSVAASRSAKSALPPLAAFQRVQQLDLRRPLYDAPPPVPVVVAATPPPPLTVKLTGTIIEPGHNLAMLQTAEGKVQLLGEGQSAGGAQILKIEDGSITLRYYGQDITLKVEKPGKS